MTDHPAPEISLLGVRVSAIIFDLDGTLYQSRGLKFRMGLRCLPKIKSLRLMISQHRVRMSLEGRQFQTQEALHQQLFADIEKETGISPEQTRNWYENRFYPLFCAALKSAHSPRPGLVPLLEKLRRRQMPAGLISNYAAIRPRLQALGIPPDYFSAILSAESVAALKPHPLSLLEMAKGWSLPPQRVLLVGDRPGSDGQAAKNADMPCLLIDDDRQQADIGDRSLMTVAWDVFRQAVEHG